MSYNNNQNQLCTNVLNKNKTLRVIEATMDHIYNTVATTLGPYGRNVIISDSHLNHFCTKDGYTVLRNMAVDGSLSRVIVNFLQRISGKLNRTVGDGTTSSIIIARNLYHSLKNSYAYHTMSPKEFGDILTQITNEIIVQLKKNATLNFGPELLYTVAYTSSNRDKDIAYIVTKAFKDVGEFGMVSVAEGKVHKASSDVISYTTGFELWTDCDIATYMTDAEKQVYDVSGDVFVFMSKVPLIADHIKGFLPVLQTLNAKYGDGFGLIMLAPGFDQSFVDLCSINKNSKMKLCPVSTKVDGDEAKVFEDLAVFLGMNLNGIFGVSEFDMGKFVKEMGSIDFLGKCGQIKVTQTKSSFIGFIDTDEEAVKRLEARKQSILDEIEKVQADDLYQFHDQKIATLEKRVASLQKNSAAVITVGGATQQEAKTRYFLVEDAVQACRSAYRYGINIGANYSIFRAIKKACPDNIDETCICNSIHNTLAVSKEYWEKQHPVSSEHPIKEESIYTAFFSAIIKTMKELVRPMAEKKGISLDNKVLDIISNYSSGNAYNLATDTYEDTYGEDIPMNSAESDILVLETSISIVKLLLMSELFVSTDAMMNNEDGLITNEVFRK